MRNGHCLGPQLKGMIMIVFAETTVSEEPVLHATKLSKQKTGKREKELEIELQRSYEELQSTHEEMQTSQEELKSTNEELQSTNEELQSTNEELTTSKEEMQSLNEELQTVNIELQSKVNDFLVASDDMKNLLNSTEIATLFLDKDLNIRKYTHKITNIFKLRETDIGRPITDLVNFLKFPEMENLAKNVIKTLVPEEKEIETNNKKWFNIRIMPYRTTDDRIDGLVLTFNDITVAKELEIKLKEINMELIKNKTKG